MADDLGLLGGCFSSIEPTPVRMCTLLTSLSFPASSKYSSRPLSGPDAALGWVCMSVVTMCVWSDNNLRTKWSPSYKLAGSSQVLPTFESGGQQHWSTFMVTGRKIVHLPLSNYFLGTLQHRPTKREKPTVAKMQTRIWNCKWVVCRVLCAKVVVGATSSEGFLVHCTGMPSENCQTDLSSRAHCKPTISVTSKITDEMLIWNRIPSFGKRTFNRCWISAMFTQATCQNPTRYITNLRAITTPCANALGDFCFRLASAKNRVRIHWQQQVRTMQSISSVGFCLICQKLNSRANLILTLACRLGTF